MYIGVVLVIIVILFATCEEDPLLLNIDCDECYYPEPDSADLVVHVTLDNDIQEVPLVFYEGKADRKIVEYVDTARTTPYYLYVKIGKLYSVEAKYQLSNKTIIAVDGTKIKSREVTDYCSETCYVMRNKNLYVELKEK